MATEDEAREAADGKLQFIQEFQVEAVHSEPFHMQTHPDSKLSSMEIKNVGEINDSTDGTLKIPEDQILVEVPTEMKLLDHNLNGTASSLNGHMVKENKISNEPLHEESKKDHEQIEAASDGEGTDQKNKINKEANECFSHGETTTEDNSLPKQGKEEEAKGYNQQDEDPIPDTLQADSDIDQSHLVDHVDHNMDLAKATDDTPPASMANIPNDEIITEACAEGQSPPDANQDDSDAILDTVHRSTEKDEAAREDGAIHLEHRESFPKDTSNTKHMEEVVQAEDQLSEQANATDADAMQEDIPRCEETCVSEEIHISEPADESIIDAQEELHQEPSEDTTGPVYGEKEQTSQQSSMAASDETISEAKGDDKEEKDPTPDTLETEIDIDQSRLVVDQLDHNMDLVKATEDTQPTSMANIPNTVVVTAGCDGVQSPLDANMDYSDSIQDTFDGNTEKDEAAREDGAIHLEQRESYPEDTFTTKHTQEVVKVDDQQSTQADATYADTVQEDITKCEETGVSEEIPKSEHADESTIDAQEELHQENCEHTNGSAHGETEQTSQQSRTAASEEPKGDDKLDEDPMSTTLKTDSDIDQSKLVVHQLDHNMDQEKATKDTQPASMANITNAEVVTEACAAVQSPLDAIPDSVHGSTEKDEAAREGGAIHIEHRESFTEDTSTAKHIEEVVKAEDQQSKQDHVMDADAVQEDKPEYEETGLSEETPKSEHADESIIDAEEEFHQEPSEDTIGLVYGEKEQTSQQSSMAASDDTTSEAKGDGKQEEDPTPDTLETEIDIDQSQLAVDQLDHNMDPVKAIEDTQPASMANIPNTMVVTAGCAGVQSPLNANMDYSDSIQDTFDENTAREDGAIHLEQRESYPEDTFTTKHTQEVVKADDQQSTQADATDAYTVQEDITECEETGVSEEIPKCEHADGLIIDYQEELHQESSEDTNGPAYGKMEQTSQQSSITASDDTASEHDSTNCEPPVDIQVQNKELLEEMKDPEAVHNEAAMQRSCANFEDTISEYHVPSTEQHSVEINSTESAKTHNVQIVNSSEEDKTENIEREPTSTSQEVDNVGATEEIMDHIAESTVGVTNVATVDEANKEKDMLRAEDIAEKQIQGIESEDSKEPVETKEVSLLDDSAQDDNTLVSERHQEGSALEINETEATRIKAVPEETNASVSEEPSSEDNVTESGTGGDDKEVHTTESLEVIYGNKDTKTREISSQSNMDSSGKTIEESNAPESEPTSEIQQEKEPESEEMKDTQHAQVNKSSTETCAIIIHEQIQENNVMESGDMSDIEATEVQAAPHCDHPEEKTKEETITTSEAQTQEPESVEKMNDIEATEPQNISQKSITSPYEEFVTEEIAKEDIVTIEPDDCHHQPQDPEIVELDKTETNKSQEIASSGIVSNYEESISVDNVTVTEPNPETQAESLRSAEVIEDTNVEGNGPLVGEVAHEENVESEATVDISPVQEPELEQGKNTEQDGTENNITQKDLPEERIENEAVPYESPVASITEMTENDILTAITPPADIQPLLKQESIEDKGNETTEKPRETEQVISSVSDELVPEEDNAATAEPAYETLLNNVASQGIKDSEEAQTDQFSNLDSFPAPGEAAEEIKSPRVETSDVQEVQDSTEETGGIKAAENEDHQQHRVSTFEEPEVDSKPSVDHQEHKEKTAEFKDNETLETEQILEQSNISTPDNAPGDRSELGDDPEWSVQPAQQLESSRESEDCNLLNEEETSGQKIVTLEDTATEIVDEIEQPVGMEQEHEQKSVEDVKDISPDQAKEGFHTSQSDASDKLASESNTATTEPTNVQQVNDLETNEMKSTGGTDDGDNSCEQTEITTSVESSSKDNETAPREHPVESHKENLENDIENAMSVHAIKDEIQTTEEQKDDAFDLDGTVPTTKEISMADEDITQSSGEEILESSNSTDPIKKEPKDGIGETVTERGTTESQALIENDAQASQDVTSKDDSVKSGQQTNDHRQSGDVENQPHTSESPVDEEYVQKVSLDEQHKEDEEVESQQEQLQANEKKHKDESDDISNEPLVESKNTENGTTNRTEETNTLADGQTTEAAVSETLKNEQALRTSEDSTASITDTTVEDLTGPDKVVEEENRPSSANTSNADAKMGNQEDQEDTEMGNIVPMDYTGERDETTDEITNEELEQGLASPVQEISYTAPSKDHIVENDPIDVPYNAESGRHKDKECANKVNDNLLAIQESEKEIVSRMQENKEMQIEAKVLYHAEPYNADTKIDDTIHNTTEQHRDIEQIGENRGLSSIDKPVEETSEQNNVEQHLSIHHKIEDERLESTDDNDVELEATQQKVDTSNVDTNNDGRMSMSNFITKHESESADNVLQLEAEGNTFIKDDETFSSVPETVTSNEEICDKVASADRGLSDESLKTFDETQRNLDVSSVVTASNEESMNEEMEEHKLAVPGHLTMHENTPKSEEKDDKIHKELDEEDISKPDFSDDQKEVEQDLPVSNFLMNLILGKENSDTHGHSEPEEETNQEEIKDDNICLVIPNQEESLVLPPTENNVEDEVTIGQEKNDVKCSAETHEVVEEQSHDLKLATETGLETDAESNIKSHHLELPPYQDKMQDEICNETLSEKTGEVYTEMEAKDTTISNIEQDDREVDTPCQENTEPMAQNEHESLDDVNNTKTSEENTLGEGQRGILPECLNDTRGVNSVSEQTLLLTESDMLNARCLSSEADSVQNSACEIQDKYIGATSIPDIQVESNGDMTEDKQPTTTDTADAEEHVEISNDNLQKSIYHQATSGDQESQIPEQVSGTKIALGREKENSEGSSSTFMDKKEDRDVLVKEGSSIQTAVEIDADDSNMWINQDKQEAPDNKNVMQSEKLEESNIQEQQRSDTQQKSPQELHEEDQHFLVEKETVIKEGDVEDTVKIHTERANIKSNDEHEFSDSKVQERDLNVETPKEVIKPEENSVDKTKPEFSTDEKQIPKVDEFNVLEEKTYEGKTKDEEKIKNFTDEAMKTEAQLAGQKASHKKQNLLSGVGSKVKRQLAKVKNVITGKPGHAKPESPKS